MKIVLLESGLFPDEDIIRDAMRILDDEEHTISRINAGQLVPDDDAAWDMAVREMMMADKIITT